MKRSPVQLGWDGYIWVATFELGLVFSLLASCLCILEPRPRTQATQDLSFTSTNIPFSKASCLAKTSMSVVGRMICLKERGCGTNIWWTVFKVSHPSPSFPPVGLYVDVMAWIQGVILECVDYKIRWWGWGRRNTRAEGSNGLEHVFQTSFYMRQRWNLHIF